MSDRKDWMTDDQFACFSMLADVCLGFHHIYGTPKPHGNGIEISLPHGWATFDFDRLTRLVFAAHDQCVRVEIRQSGPRMLRFILHKRHARDGRMHRRHPTIEHALSQWREAFPAGPDNG